MSDSMYDSWMFDWKREYDKELEERRLLLLADLSIRVNNQHIGSGIGGNPSQLAHLMQHKVIFDVERVGPDVVVTSNGKTVVFTFSTNAVKRKPDLRVIRKALDEYWDLLAEKEEVSFEQLTSVDWWKDRAFTPEALTLVSFLHRIDDLISETNEKCQILDAFLAMTKKERNEVKKQFFAEMGIVDHLEFRKNPSIDKRQFDMIAKVLEKHPVYSKKLERISKREDRCVRSILSEKNRLLLKTIDVLPEFLSATVMRKMGIELIIKLSFDLIMNTEAEDKIYSKYNNPVEEE